MYKGAHREDFDTVQDAVSDLWYIGVDRMVPEKTSAVVGAIEDDDYTSEYVIEFSLSHCDGFDYKGTSDELLDLANKCLNLAIVKHAPRTKTAFAIKSEPVGDPEISDKGWKYSVRLVWTGDTAESLSAKGSMRRKQEGLAKKSESDYGAMTWTVTVEFDDNGKVVRNDYVVKAHNRESAIDQAKLRPLRSNPNAKNIKIAQCKLGESLVKKPKAWKNETYEDFRISDEDVSLVVNYVDVDGHGGSFSVDTPENRKSYSLQEMRDIIRGMCAECSGYASISRDGSDILIIVNAPEMDENGEWTNDYYAAYTIRCSVRVLHASIESFVDYLDKYNEE